MGEYRRTLALIKTCFANQDDLIERAVRDEDGFLALCEDYRACSEALASWNRSESAQAADRRREYAGMLVDLDREIQAWLERLVESGHQARE